MNVDFYDLLELAQLRAIHSALEPSADSIFRIKCRQYSEKFHTPLDRVMNELDPNLVLQALFEDQFPPSIVEEEAEDLLDRLYTIKDPSYRRISQEETENLVDSVLNREIARLAKTKKKAPTPENIQEAVKQAEAKPKSGSMSFGDLEKMETASEANKSGFKD
jgi:hypothetical protein